MLQILDENEEGCLFVTKRNINNDIYFFLNEVIYDNDGLKDIVLTKEDIIKLYEFVR